MKAFKILFLIFLCSVVHLSKIYAQADYVITKNRDTVFCKIKGDFFRGNLKYRVQGNNMYIKMDTDKVIQYFLANDTTTFVYKKLPGEISGSYLKWLERGKINLYELILTSGYKTKTNVVAVLTFWAQQQSSKYWYASKSADSLVEIKTNAIFRNKIGTHKERETAFMDMVSDCDYVVTEIKHSDLDKNYDFDPIRVFVKMYNEQCPNK